MGTSSPTMTLAKIAAEIGEKIVHRELRSREAFHQLLSVRVSSAGLESNAVLRKAVGDYLSDTYDKPELLDVRTDAMRAVLYDH